MANAKYFPFFLLLHVMLFHVVAAREERLYIFGDGTFDAGNNQYFLPEDEYYAPMHFPYGFTSFPHPTGRNTDGLTIPDFISNALARVHFIPPSLEPGANFSSGANFASRGAYAVPTSQSYKFNLEDQIRNFTETVATLKEKYGDAGAKSILTKSVYLFSIGRNDYIQFFVDVIDSGTHSTHAQQEAFVKTVVGNISAAVAEIYELGGRKFAFMNVGPLGCLPSIKSRFRHNLEDDGCVGLPLTLAKMHNHFLNVTLSKMAQELPGFKHSIFDYYYSVLERMNNPGTYGYINGTVACCGYEYDPYRGDGCGKEYYSLCPFPGAFVFFDGSHTTQRANLQLSRFFYFAGPPITYPYNLNQLFEDESVVLSEEDLDGEAFSI